MGFRCLDLGIRIEWAMCSDLKKPGSAVDAERKTMCVLAHSPVTNMTYLLKWKNFKAQNRSFILLKVKKTAFRSKGFKVKFGNRLKGETQVLGSVH